MRTTVTQGAQLRRVTDTRDETYNTMGACSGSRDVCSNEPTTILSSDLLFLKNV